MRQFFCALLVIGLVSGCSGKGAAPPEGPERTSLRGHEFGENVAVLNSGELAWAEDILANYKKSRSSSGRLTVENLKLSGCKKLSSAVPSNYLVQAVTIEESGLNSPLYILSEDAFLEGTAHFIKRYKETGRAVALGPQYARPTPVGLVNIIVTETEKPVVLILSSSRQTLWNIHAGKGAVIDKIILLSKTESGLANVPEGTEIFALTGEQATQNCNIVPARRPEDHWRFVKQSKEESKNSWRYELYEENVKRGAEFYNWLDRNYAIGEQDIIDANQLSQALIGPIPKKKVTYNKLDGATVLWPRTRHLILGPSSKASNPKPLGQAYIIETVTEDAGGDLENLLSQ